MSKQVSTEETINKRRTLKLKADPNNPLPITKGSEFKKTIEKLIQLAGKAPFHYQSAEHHRKNKVGGAEPWRFHALDSKTCRRLLDSFNKNEPMKASDGIRQMLAAADGLILGTWLPEKSRSLSRKYHPNVKNMEHIAATGAAIQNLLLAATDMGITNYWSSGGCIRKPKVLEFLGIPKQEILLGAIFLFPDEYPESVQTKTGKNRDVKGELTDYMDWVEVNPS
jgi:nitroreductase